MKVFALASIFALFAAVAFAHDDDEDHHYRYGGHYGGDHYGNGGHHSSSAAAQAGGSSNEGRVNGLLNNVLKHGILADNEEVSDTTIVQGDH